jgi:hypothetical protein
MTVGDCIMRDATSTTSGILVRVFGGDETPTLRTGDVVSNNV